jgi:hypothetical protein
MDDLGPDLLRDQREAGLLPGQPGRPVRDRGGTGDDPSLRDQPSVPFGVGALAHDREFCAGTPQRREQAFDVAPDATSIGGDRSGVD